jgi:hypothetical protein
VVADNNFWVIGWSFRIWGFEAEWNKPNVMGRITLPRSNWGSLKRPFVDRASPLAPLGSVTWNVAARSEHRDFGKECETPYHADLFVPCYVSVQSCMSIHSFTTPCNRLKISRQNGYTFFGTALNFGFRDGISYRCGRNHTPNPKRYPMKDVVMIKAL